MAFHGGLRKPTALHGARTGRHEIPAEQLYRAIFPGEECVPAPPKRLRSPWKKARRKLREPKTLFSEGGFPAYCP